jgi:glycosyltransferase involved in cell wall biosynthesis
MAQPRIHLINPLSHYNGGSERRTLACYELLREHADVTMWSEFTPDPEIEARYAVRRVRPWRGQFPRGGTMVFMGVYFRIGRWVPLANAQRIVLIYNTDDPDSLAKRLKRLATTFKPIEVVSSSPGLSRLLGANLPLLESPIELAPFLNLARPPHQQFTVGRLSGDYRHKHHPEDVQLYRHLAERGCRVRIMGGTCLANALHGVPNIELLPTGFESQTSFLRSLDCFIYRTADTWFEAFGRVVFEAMASGLPVVCARRGGYADYLQHGKDSLLFGNTAEAFRQILRLRDDTNLRRQLGVAAAKTACRVVGDSLFQRTREFLIGDAWRGTQSSAVDHVLQNPIIGGHLQAL